MKHRTKSSRIAEPKVPSKIRTHFVYNSIHDLYFSSLYNLGVSTINEGLKIIPMPHVVDNIRHIGNEHDYGVTIWSPCGWERDCREAAVVEESCQIMDRRAMTNAYLPFRDSLWLISYRRPNISLMCLTSSPKVR